ncbi:hypothetical protein GGF31_001579 [Allomyces arbusculus]|nr:hypothetical protein GGF31_001579 [Allomyces arbusculus]
MPSTLSGSTSRPDPLPSTSLLGDGIDYAKYGSKIRALVIYVRRVIEADPTAKLILFPLFRRLTTHFARIFRVLFLSSDDCVSGRHLVEANHVVIAHPSGCVQDHDSAARTGQTREMTVVRYVTRNTVEEMTRQRMDVRLAPAAMVEGQSHDGDVAMDARIPLPAALENIEDGIVVNPPCAIVRELASSFVWVLAADAEYRSDGDAGPVRDGVEEAATARFTKGAVIPIGLIEPEYSYWATSWTSAHDQDYTLALQYRPDLETHEPPQSMVHWPFRYWLCVLGRVREICAAMERGTIVPHLRLFLKQSTLAIRAMMIAQPPSLHFPDLVETPLTDFAAPPKGFQDLLTDSWMRPSDRDLYYVVKATLIVVSDQRIRMCELLLADMVLVTTAILQTKIETTFLEWERPTMLAVMPDTYHLFAASLDRHTFYLVQRGRASLGNETGVILERTYFHRIVIDEIRTVTPLAPTVESFKYHPEPAVLYGLRASFWLGLGETEAHTLPNEAFLNACVRVNLPVDLATPQFCTVGVTLSPVEMGLVATDGDPDGNRTDGEVVTLCHADREHKLATLTGSASMFQTSVAQNLAYVHATLKWARRLGATIRNFIAAAREPRDVARDWAFFDMAMALSRPRATEPRPCVQCEQDMGERCFHARCAHEYCGDCAATVAERSECVVCHSRVDELTKLALPSSDLTPTGSPALAVDAATYGTKIASVVTYIATVVQRDPTARFLVFSEYPRLTSLLQCALAAADVLVVNENDLDLDFNADQPTVVLLAPDSITAFVRETTHVVLVHPFVGPCETTAYAAEMSAIRHAQGVTFDVPREVTVVRFVVRGTVEEEVAVRTTGRLVTPVEAALECGGQGRVRGDADASAGAVGNAEVKVESGRM